MTLRLGFVGCGRWARKLAESFRAVGAEVVAHDRRGPRPRAIRDDLGGFCGYEEGTEPPAGFGTRMPWRDQLQDKSIDAIIAVAPPDVTTEVALECARQGKPVVATKPLFDHPERITAPFYVDFVRLFDPGYVELKRRADERHADIKEIYAQLRGSGPFREFPGFYDYGPHVAAWMFDLAGSRYELHGITSARRQAPNAQGDLIQWTCDFENQAGTDSIEFCGAAGNASSDGHRSLVVRFTDLAELRWSEEPTASTFETRPRGAGMTTDRVVALQAFCRAFLNDVSDGFVSTKLLDYSRDGMALLRRVREEAK